MTSGPNSIDRNGFDELLGAFEKIGGAQAQRAVPTLLQFYDEEPIDPEPSLYGNTLRSRLLETLRTIGVDLKPLAAKWVPRLIAPLETDPMPNADLDELGTYGKLAEAAVPALIRYARLHNPHSFQAPKALDALAKIAPEDERVKALLHLARF
jgi:hypothetical protein